MVINFCFGNTFTSTQNITVHIQNKRPKLEGRGGGSLAPGGKILGMAKLWAHFKLFY